MDSSLRSQLTEHTSKGFTLVEVMIVVVIIGLLATLAWPAYQQMREAAQNVVFINDMRAFATSIEHYMTETGEYLEDSSSGAIPAGLEEYIIASKWTDRTPIGGQWDMELDSFGIRVAFGVHGPNAGEEQILAIDEDFDDGDLTTGRFRKLGAGRYYYVLEDNS